MSRFRRSEILPWGGSARGPGSGAEPPGTVHAGSAQSPLLTVEGVSYSYASGVEVLAGVGLRVGRGEVVSIVGPSGCGKSTLLSLLVGMLRPLQGEVTWAPGRRTATVGLEEAPLRTLVFQKDTLLPWLTVEANVGLGLRYVRGSKQSKRQRVDQLLELAGLTGFRRSYPYELSGGMRRRVSLLTGMAPAPSVLLLDEPFSALDEPTRVTLHVEFLKLVRELEMAVVLVTHDLAEAITMSDRVYVLSARPARVLAVHDVPFGARRDVFAVRETDHYHLLYKAIWGQLRQEFSSPQASGDQETAEASAGPGG